MVDVGRRSAALLTAEDLLELEAVNMVGRRKSEAKIEDSMCKGRKSFESRHISIRTPMPLNLSKTQSTLFFRRTE